MMKIFLVIYLYASFHNHQGEPAVSITRMNSWEECESLGRITKEFFDSNLYQPNGAGMNYTMYKCIQTK